MKKTLNLFLYFCLLDLLIYTSTFAQDAVPNDSLFFLQKRIFDKLQVLDAWKITKGSPEVKIGVLDNGFDFFHPDLYGQLIPGFYAPGAYHTETYENVAHGTLVSSIIVAKGNNKIGMTGLAPNCKVITASYGCIEHAVIKLQKKYFKDYPDSTTAGLQRYMKSHIEELSQWGASWMKYIAESNAAAIIYLVDAGVKVINISSFLSGSSSKSSESWDKLENAFRYAAKKNVLIIIGAGNSAKETEDYPGNKDSMIVVGASTIDDKAWYKEMDYNGQKIIQGSHFGSRLTVMAPPDSIVICTPSYKRYYNSADGPTGKVVIPYEGDYSILAEGATSSATPMVTALAALIYSIIPDASPAMVRDLIIKGCDDIGEPGFDIHTGYGRINFYKTLKLAKELK